MGIKPAAPPASKAKPQRQPGKQHASDPETAKAERLARITISDIVLYNEEKFSRAAAAGKVAQAFTSELEEARQHFDSRVPEHLRGQRDFLLEELKRRAEALGKRA